MRRPNRDTTDSYTETIARGMGWTIYDRTWSITHRTMLYGPQMTLDESIHNSKWDPKTRKRYDTDKAEQTKHDHSTPFISDHITPLAK